MYQITRIYDQPANVEATILRLRQEGFGDDSLQITTPSSQPQEWALTVHYVFGMGRRVTDILDRFAPLTESALRHAGHSHAHRPAYTQAHSREPGVEAIADLSGPRSPGSISDLSGPVRPGSISDLSGPVRPGSIAVLSGRRAPGAISQLSRRVAPGSISRLSRWVSPGAISRLSGPTPPGAVASLASGWYVSSLLGLPLLTRDS
jgi:hypothetical protein